MFPKNMMNSKDSLKFTQGQHKWSSYSKNILIQKPSLWLCFSVNLENSYSITSSFYHPTNPRLYLQLMYHYVHMFKRKWKPTTQSKRNIPVVYLLFLYLLWCLNCSIRCFVLSLRNTDIYRLYGLACLPWNNTNDKTNATQRNAKYFDQIFIVLLHHYLSSFQSEITIIFVIFRAQEPKAPVTYCDHALSGVCRPSSVVRLSSVVR